MQTKLQRTRHTMNDMQWVGPIGKGGDAHVWSPWSSSRCAATPSWFCTMV